MFSEVQNCTGNMFQCNAERCIDKTWTCDGEPDCRDGKDESPEAGCGKFNNMSNSFSELVI